MPFDEYQVDYLAGETREKLNKMAGTDPEDRITAYTRMEELMRFYIREESKKARERGERVE